MTKGVQNKRANMKWQEGTKDTIIKTKKQSSKCAKYQGHRDSKCVKGKQWSNKKGL